jgi:hypothetical protein
MNLCPDQEIELPWRRATNRIFLLTIIQTTSCTTRFKWLKDATASNIKLNRSKLNHTKDATLEMVNCLFLG